MYVAIPTTNLKQVEVHAFFQNSCRMRVKHRYRAGHILIMSHLGWVRVDLLGLTLNIQFSLIQNNSPAAWLLDYHDVTQITSASKRYLWGFESNVRRTLVNSPSRKTRPRQPNGKAQHWHLGSTFLESWIQPRMFLKAIQDLETIPNSKPNHFNLIKPNFTGRLVTWLSESILENCPIWLYFPRQSFLRCKILHTQGKTKIGWPRILII